MSDDAQIDLLSFVERGQKAQAEVNRILQKSDATARSRPRARGTDPQTSHKAAKRAKEGLTLKQQAVLECFQGTGRPMTDPEFIATYNRRRSYPQTPPLNWPAQSDSGLRTRRHELVEAEKLMKVGEQEREKGKPFTLWGLRKGP